MHVCDICMYVLWYEMYVCNVMSCDVCMYVCNVYYVRNVMYVCMPVCNVCLDVCM